MDNAPFQGRLLSGETIVWSGQPVQGLTLTYRDFFLVPFSLLWGGFAIFWETLVLTTRAPLFMALFGVPFVLVGLFLIFGRLLLDSWLRRKTYFAITDLRVLILRERPFAAFTALALDRLSQVAVVEASGGRGTIRFAQPAQTNWGGSRGGGFWVPALEPTPQFLEIPDVASVAAMVHERASPARTP